MKQFHRCGYEGCRERAEDQYDRKFYCREHFPPLIRDRIVECAICLYLVLHGKEHDGEHLRAYKRLTYAVEGLDAVLGAAGGFDE